MNNFKKNSCDVLIVGAGPTGLTLANILQQYGINFQIIDSRSGISRIDSKCTTTHVRVLEIFKQLGILEELSYEENVVRGLVFKYRYNKKWKNVMSMTTELISQELLLFNHALSMPQWKLEQAMLSTLMKNGNCVGYNLKFIELRQEKESVLATVNDLQNNQEFNIRCQYLIGCDGIKSTVREQAKILRIGSTYQDFFIIADCHVDNFNYPLDRRYTFSGRKYYLHIGHLGNNLFRIFITYHKEFVDGLHYKLWVGNCQDNMENSRETLQWFQQRISELGLPFELYNPIRFSTYNVFLGYANYSHLGRVFLAGDAAHSHSPDGGQGMNTGVMDAHNLGWKLAYSILGITQNIVLESYGHEREPIWRELVKTTDFIKNLFSRKTYLSKCLSDYIFPILPKYFLQKMAKKWSMLELKYSNSPISVDCFSNKFQGVKSGERAPDSHLLLMNNSQTITQKCVKIRLHHLIYDNHGLGEYIVLFYDRSANCPKNYQEILNLKKSIQKCFKAKFRYYYIIPEDSLILYHETIPILIDIDNVTFKKYGVGHHKTLYFIRPDGYIAYRNQPFQADKFMKYLKKIFIEF